MHHFKVTVSRRRRFHLKFFFSYLMTDFRQRSIQRGYTGDASYPECETTAYSGNQLHSSSQVSLQTYSKLE